MFSRQALGLPGKRQKLVAEPRHVFLNHEPNDVFWPSAVLLFHFARNVRCPNISDSTIREALPIVACTG